MRILAWAGLSILALIFTGASVVSFLLSKAPVWESVIAVVLALIWIQLLRRMRWLLSDKVDDELRALSHRYRGLKGRSWDETLAELEETSGIRVLPAPATLAADPRTWWRKQRMVFVADGNLLIRLLENRGAVGSVSLSYDDNLATHFGSLLGGSSSPTLNSAEDSPRQPGT